ncbi:hypothetical protein [Streptomyces xanthochromogenes]|uniref:hypothetical protein n=1 Tax=Streptomyces xanthochromogenes TaxID=67384 RepID=UPI002F3F8C41
MSITLHPMRTVVSGKRSSQIRVYSQATQPQYLQVSLRKVLAPGQEDEREVEVEPGEAHIAVTPSRFALAGGGNRLVRIVPLKEVAEHELFYRVLFETVRGPEDESVPGEADQVGVNLVWGCVVTVRPETSNSGSDHSA